MDEVLTKEQLLDTMRAKRAEWDALLAEAGEARMLEPGPAGAWSLKDVIAHVTVYERWTLRRLQIGLSGETYVRSGPDLIEDVDARNAAYHEQDRDRSLADVRAESDQVYHDLRAFVESQSADDLANPAHFGFRPDVHPTDLIAGNGYGHYDEHIPHIRAWLDGTTVAA